MKKQHTSRKYQLYLGHNAMPRRSYATLEKAQERAFTLIYKQEIGSVIQVCNHHSTVCLELKRCLNNIHFSFWSTK